MHNDTPLGMAMHLQELDRQAAPKFASLPPKAQQELRVTSYRRSMETLLRRIRAVVLGDAAQCGQASKPAGNFPSPS